jgi:K+-transporting ATPase KdpF subunit
MTGIQILAAILTLGLLIYLGFALLTPERFQ